MYELLDAPVPDAVRARAEAVVADVLAATVAGTAEPVIRDVGETAGFDAGPARVLGVGRRLSVPQAALVNGAAAITPEIEEGHNTGGHVGAGIVVGGLVAAEAADASGSALVDAVARSYEICVRLEYAIFAMKDQLNRAIPWLVRDPHSTWTTVGPALTAAQVLGHDADALRETFRIAANLAVVSMHDPYAEGAPARNFTAGFSAQAGVSAALSAGAGLRGSATAIEAVYDPFEDLLDTGEFAALFAELGTNWRIHEHYQKPYPSCRYTHPPLDALRDALATVERDVSPPDVSAVTVHTFRNATEMSHTSPTTMTSAKFSTPYVLARYLQDGAVALEHFTADAIADPGVQSLAERVSLEIADEYESAFPESWGARVSVTLADGTRLTGDCDYPRGDHRRPMDEAAVRARNRALLAWGLDGDADAALSALETVRDRPVREVVDALCT